MIRSVRFRVQLASLILAMSALAFAQVPSSDDSGFIDGRLQTASHADTEQPHWIAPLFTTTPRLLEQLRFDIATQPKKEFEATNFGGGKGLELIPFRNTEILISTPPYVTHDKPGVQDGIGDMSFLLKYRVAAGNEESGNYIVTAFLGASVPTGVYSNGRHQHHRHAHDCRRKRLEALRFSDHFRYCGAHGPHGQAGNPSFAQHRIPIPGAGKTLAGIGSELDLLAKWLTIRRQAGLSFARPDRREAAPLEEARHDCRQWSPDSSDSLSYCRPDLAHLGEVSFLTERRAVFTSWLSS
jgi:hypothetical protein